MKTKKVILWLAECSVFCPRLKFCHKNVTSKNPWALSRAKKISKKNLLFAVYSYATFCKYEETRFDALIVRLSEDSMAKLCRLGYVFFSGADPGDSGDRDSTSVLEWVESKSEMTHATEHGLFTKVHRLASLSFLKFFFLKKKNVSQSVPGASHPTDYTNH